MPCINMMTGQPIAGVGDRGMCVAYGGDWMEEPSLMQDTDDFGNPLSTDFSGRSAFDARRDQEINRLNEMQFTSGSPPSIGEPFQGGAMQDPNLLNAMYNGLGTSYQGGATQDPNLISLMNKGIGTSYSMGQGQKRNFMTPSTSQLGSPYMGLPPTRKIGTSYGKGQGEQRSFTDPGLGYPNTDDFGRPLNTNFEGDSNFGLLRDQAVTKFNKDAFNERNRYGVGGATPKVTPVDTPNYKDMFTPVQGPFSGTGFTDEDDIVTLADLDNMSIGKLINMSIEDIGEVPVLGNIHDWINPSADIGKLVDTITDPELRADAIQFVIDNPKTAGTAAVLSFLATKSKKVKKLWNKIKGRYQNNLVRNNATTGKFEAVAGGLEKTKLATDAAKIYYGTKAVTGLIDPETGIQTEPFVKSSVENLKGLMGTDVTSPKTDVTSGVGTGGTDKVDLLSPTKDRKVQGPLSKDGTFKQSDVSNIFTDKTGKGGEGQGTPDSIWDRMQTKEYWFKKMSNIPGDTRLQRLMDEFRYASFTNKQKSAMGGKSPSDKRRDAALKQQELGVKALSARLKAAAANKGYQWKAKEIETYSSSYFDDYFGFDWPGGKDRDNQRDRFIMAVADSKKLPGNENVPLQDIIAAVLEKGKFR